MNLLPNEMVYVVPHNILQYVYESSTTTSTMKCFFRGLGFIILAVMNICFVLEILFAENEEIVIKTLDPLVGFCQIMLKFCLFVYCKPQINQIMAERSNKFWNYNSVDKNTFSDIMGIYNNIRKIQIIMLISYASAVQMLFLSTLFKEEKFVPFEMWMSDILGICAALILCQYYVITVSTLYILCFDFIYFSLCADLIVQLRLMKYELQHLPSEQSTQSSTIYRLIEHHQYLLR